jgi:hypothetical protein
MRLLSVFISSSALAIGLLMGCNTNSDNSTKLITANNVSIQLQIGEKTTDLNNADKASLKKYEQYFNRLPNHQIPLNKVFYGNHTTWYYGLPLDADVNTLFEAYRVKLAKNLIDNQPFSNNEAALFAKDSGNFITISIFNTEDGKLLVGGAISSDSEYINSLYESHNIKQRTQNEPKK